jgi:hypothetical protein
MKVMNKNLRPGMVLNGGTKIIEVRPTRWKKEVYVTYQRPGQEAYMSIWSATAYKEVHYA